MYNIEEMPDYIQKINKSRRVWLLITLVAFAGIFIMLTINFLSAGDGFAGVVGALMFSSYVLSLYAQRYFVGTYKSILNKMKKITIVVFHPLFLLVFFPLCMVFVISMYVGWVFTVRDAIFFFLKKPLVSEKEANAIIQEKQMAQMDSAYFYAAQQNPQMAQFPQYQQPGQPQYGQQQYGQPQQYTQPQQNFSDKL